MSKIPKIIHQTYSSPVLPDELESISRDLRLRNPDWEYRFYDEEARSSFISKNYDPEVYSIYNSINPSYGAARADLFRYLVLYKEGGVYLDIKSSCSVPLSDLIDENDEFFISNWPNLKGEEFYGAGLLKELQDIEYGEYQQWYIISKPNSPFLKAVIDKVLSNIKDYTPWKVGVAKVGVLRLTGPIPYTLAIHPLLNKYSHRYVRKHDDFNLKYSMLTTQKTHIKLMKSHYSLCSEPIRIPRTRKEVLYYKTFILARFFVRTILRRDTEYFKFNERLKILYYNLTKF